MSSNKQLEEWYAEKIEINPKGAIKNNLSRLELVFDDYEGNITPKNTNISVAKQICSVCIGHAVSFHAGRRENPHIKTNQLYELINDDEKNIRANLSQMKSKGYIRKIETGSYEINYSCLSKTLDYILGDSK